MDIPYLKCSKCGKAFKYDDIVWRCDACGSPLNVIYESKFEIGQIQFKLMGLWKFKRFLPPTKNRVSLGEGNTPIIRAILGSKEAFLKLDYIMPSGSFKDRGAALAISWVISKTKYRTVIEDSSGNAGIAVSAYAAKAGIKARIYVPETIPEGKYFMLKLLGAEVIKAGDRNEAHKRALSDHEGYYIGHVVNPLFIEGIKDIALEIIKDLGGAPDYVVAPVASGTLILALAKGFNELKRLGVLTKTPRLIAVQACGYSTLMETIKTYSVECNKPSRLADALRLTIVPRLKQIIDVLKESKGFNVVVGDKAIIDALKELWSMGFAAEPSSATAYAAYKFAVSKGIISKKESIVIIITGSGLKYITDIAKTIL